MYINNSYKIMFVIRNRNEKFNTEIMIQRIDNREI